MRRRSPTCSGPTSSRRPGSPPPRCGRPGAWSGCERAWSGCALVSSARSTRSVAEEGERPEMTDLFGVGGRRFLAEANLPSRSRARIDAHLRLVDAVDQEITRAERELRDLFDGDERGARLMPRPGVGFLTAATMVAEVGEVGRLRGPD